MPEAKDDYGNLQDLGFLTQGLFAGLSLFGLSGQGFKASGFGFEVP